MKSEKSHLVKETTGVINVRCSSNFPEDADVPT